MPNSLLLLKALADHELVALLEDVERHELARQQHEPEREEGEALDSRGHLRSGQRRTGARLAAIVYNRMDRISRRQLIVSGALAAGALVGSPRLLREALAAPARAGVSPYGPLGAPDANGLMLPPDSARARWRAALAGGRISVAGRSRRAGHLLDARRRLDPRHELGVPRTRRRGHIGDPLPAGRRRSRPPIASSAERTSTAPAGRPRGAPGCRARSTTPASCGSATRRAS